MWPGTFSLSVKMYPKGGTAMFFPIMLVVGILLIKEESKQLNECDEKENIVEYKM